jgi:hypothetical protein
VKSSANNEAVLSDGERDFVHFALGEWGGPASYAPLPITAMGFRSWTDFDEYVTQMRARLKTSDGPGALPDIDLARILFLAEMSFVSDLVGSGVEWFGVDDNSGIGLLRSLQLKLSTPRRAELLFPGYGEPRSGPIPDTDDQQWEVLESALEAEHPEQFRPRHGMWLTVDERAFIWHALALWYGPASRKPMPLSVFNFRDWNDLDHVTHRLRAAMIAGGDYQGLSELDVARMLLLTELSWGSDLLGSGTQFSALTGITDNIAVALLRQVQRKVATSTRADLLLPGCGRSVPSWTDGPTAD